MNTELSCQQTVSMLSDYIDGLLDAETAESVWQHLQECEACMDEYESLDKIVFLLGSVAESSIPPAFSINLKAALREEPVVKKRRGMRTRLQFGAMAAVLTIGLFTFWVYNNIDMNSFFNADLGDFDLSRTPVSTNDPLETAEGISEEPATTHNVSGSDNDVNITDNERDVTPLNDSNGDAERNPLPRDNSDNTTVSSGADTENDNANSDSSAGGETSRSGENSADVNVSDSSSTSSNTDTIADTDTSAEAGAASSQRSNSSSATTTNPSSRPIAEISAQVTKPRVLVSELTLMEMLSRLPEKAAEGQQADNAQTSDSEKNLDTNSSNGMKMYSSENSPDSGALLSPSKAPVLEESATTSESIESSPSVSNPAAEPSRSSATTGGALHLPNNAGGLAKYDKQIQEKLSGCDYKVLYVETEGNKYDYRVRLISNMNGAVIDLELDFVFDIAGMAIYYADKTDTMM